VPLLAAEETKASSAVLALIEPLQEQPANQLVRALYDWVKRTKRSPVAAFLPLTRLLLPALAAHAEQPILDRARAVSDKLKELRRNKKAAAYLELALAPFAVQSRAPPSAVSAAAHAQLQRHADALSKEVNDRQRRLDDSESGRTDLAQQRAQRALDRGVAVLDRGRAQLAADETKVSGVRTAQRKNKELREENETLRANLAEARAQLRALQEQVRALDLLFDGAEAGARDAAADASEAQRRGNQLLQENKELKAEFEQFLKAGRVVPGCCRC
jgi:DNA repair exonuclease SbcCD ATPase subunit